MADVRLLSTCMVQATINKETPEMVELTQCDLKFILLGAIQKGLLFLKPKPSEDQSLILIQDLKASLSQTLELFTPLAGRLAMVENDDNTISYFIECNNAGAQFVHAVADGVSIADILQPVYVPQIVHSFFPLNGVLNYEGVSKPLLAVQVTELVDGIFIGCTTNHVVVDGTSFWNFFNSWSELHRGLGHISNPPVLERMLNNVNSSSSNCLPIRLPRSIIKSNSAMVVPPPLRERVFHFTKERIARLKAKANAEAATTLISSLQSLLAHVWKSAARNGQVTDLDKEVDLVLLLGLRTRLNPPLPEKYFGNAIVTEIVTLPKRELLDQGLGFVALQINKVVSSYTAGKVKEMLESSLENLNPASIGDLATNHRFGISSSPRFNVYGTDFGWGRPVAVRSGPGNKFNGKITLFPGMEEGSVDIEICVLPETLKAMGNDLDFMDVVTI